MRFTAKMIFTDMWITEMRERDHNMSAKDTDNAGKNETILKRGAVHTFVSYDSTDQLSFNSREKKAHETLIQTFQSVRLITRLFHLNRNHRLSFQITTEVVNIWYPA